MSDFSPRPAMAKQKTSADAPRSSAWLAWILTLIFHALLLGVFALVNVGWQYDIPEWVEMEFIAVDQPRTAPTPATLEPAVQPVTPKATPPQIVHLPERRMLEDEVPFLRTERRHEFDIAPENPRALEQRDDERRPESAMPLPAASGSDKAVATHSDIKVGDKNVRVGAQDLGKGLAVPFQIEGEAAARTVVQKVIPEYPSGLAREAEVKISFVVLPSGVVASAVPVLKGDATLERVALDAFRQWRFSPLAPDKEQHNQQGVITFRFVLR